MIGQYSDDSQHSTVVTTANGRVFTPGLAIIDSPQPSTPMGGDSLQIALDISGDGALPFSPSSNPSAATRFHNMTMFLTSTTLGKNFTVSNATGNTAPLLSIFDQEPDSTVKHVNFEWPACLVGDGKDASGSARGAYNISLHQSFRLNGSDFYTIFNLQISVTNAMERSSGAEQLRSDPKPGPLTESGGRVECGALENEVLGLKELVKSVRNPGARPFGESGELEGVNAGSGGGQVGGSGRFSGQQSDAPGAGSEVGFEIWWILMPVALLMALQ